MDLNTALGRVLQGAAVAREKGDGSMLMLHPEEPKKDPPRVIRLYPKGSKKYPQGTFRLYQEEDVTEADRSNTDWVEVTPPSTKED